MIHLIIFSLFSVLVAQTALTAETVGWRSDGDGRYLDAELRSTGRPIKASPGRR